MRVQSLKKNLAFSAINRRKGFSGLQAQNQAHTNEGLKWRIQRWATAASYTEKEGSEGRRKKKEKSNGGLSLCLQGRGRSFDSVG